MYVRMQGYHEEAREQAQHFFAGTPLLKYARANVLDYGDEFPRLPADVNPLHPGMSRPVLGWPLNDIGAVAL